MIMLNKERKPLCLACADLDHLSTCSWKYRAHAQGDPVFAPTGGGRSVESTNHHEPQGILAEPKAIERAEAECLGDADRRQSQRAR